MEICIPSKIGTNAAVIAKMINDTANFLFFYKFSDAIIEPLKHLCVVCADIRAPATTLRLIYNCILLCSGIIVMVRSATKIRHS